MHSMSTWCCIIFFFTLASHNLSWFLWQPSIEPKRSDCQIFSFLVFPTIRIDSRTLLSFLPCLLLFFPYTLFSSWRINKLKFSSRFNKDFLLVIYCSLLNSTTPKFVEKTTTILLVVGLHESGIQTGNTHDLSLLESGTLTKNSWYPRVT